MSAHPKYKSIFPSQIPPYPSWFPKLFLQLYYSVSLAPSTDIIMNTINAYYNNIVQGDQKSLCT